jgi:hypothetical protein
MLLGLPATDFLAFVARVVLALTCRPCPDTPRGAVLVNGKRLPDLVILAKRHRLVLGVDAFAATTFSEVHRARRRPLPFVVVTCSR